MATIIPPPVGSGNIAQNFAFAGQQLGGGIGQFLARRRQQEQQQRQQQALQQLAQQQNINLPSGLRQGFAEQLLFGEQQRRGRPTVQPKTSFQQIPDPATGKTVNALVNSETGAIIKTFGATEDLTGKDKIEIARSEGKDFRADPRIEDFQIIERSERGMQAALKQSTSPNVESRIASDQALGVLFQKMLDPTSVVRESEFARTPEGAALMSRVSAQIPKLIKGGLAISDSDRQALVDMAQKLLNEAKISANRAFDEFSLRADTIGLNPKIVFGGAKRFNIQTEQGPLSTNQDILAEDRRIAELEAKARQ